MSVANFEALCAGYFDVTGLEAPPLVPHANGITAFNMNMRGVQITVGHDANKAPWRAFIVVEFGAVPPEHDEEVWPMLLDLNFAMFREGSPVFSRNPHNGEVLLQLTYAFDGATPTGLVALLDWSVGIALDWRKQFEHSESSLLGCCL